MSERIIFPVRYDPTWGTVVDCTGRIVCDLKDWGNMTRSKPELQLEAIGEKITKLLNEVGNEKKEKQEHLQIRSSFSHYKIPEEFEWD